MEDLAPEDVRHHLISFSEENFGKGEAS
jgi:hypothetical protein